MSTASMPTTAARTPARIESVPSDGPTVRSSRYLIPAGRAPERRIMARSFACCSVKRPLITPVSRIGSLMTAFSCTLLSSTTARSSPT